ncbi:MAG: hypothetical protein U0457_19530 [Candidatus Sericytochromatia bacterium]
MNKYFNTFFCGILLLTLSCPRTAPSNIIPSDSFIQNTKIASSIKVIFDSECASQSNKISYQIKEDGTFFYFDITSIDNIMKQRKLSTSEISKLNSLLKKDNILVLANKSTFNYDNVPQTTECRTLEKYTLNIDGLDKTFELNSRNIINTPEYINYFNNIKNYLEELKQNSNAEQPSNYKYDFPLKINTYNECFVNSSSKITYQINQDGNFYYLDDPKTSETTSMKSLSKKELDEVKDLLLNLDIAKLSEQDTKISSSDLQTTDCKNMKEVSFLVNDQNRTFDFNARVFNHTSEYTSALTKLEKKLSELKNAKTDSIYGFPMEFSIKDECSKATLQAMYRVYQDGRFSYRSDSYSSDVTYTNLPAKEITKLQDFINNIDFKTLSRDDIPYPSDSIQTTDCRKIKIFTTTINGIERSFYDNDRVSIHSKQYTSAMNSIAPYFKELTYYDIEPLPIPTPTPTPTPTATPIANKYTYSLPLKVTLEGECNSNITTAYEITANGKLTYSDPSVSDGFSVNPIISRQLTSFEIKYIKDALTNLNIAYLAEGNKIAPDNTSTFVCSTIKNFSLTVNGLNKIYDENGRKYIHTSEYKKALASLEDILKNLKG